MEKSNGRPPSALAGDGYVGAVDLGGTKILAAIVSPAGEIVARSRKATGKDGRPAPVLDRIAACVRDAAREAGVDAAELKAVGIGAPGPVDAEHGILRQAVNLDEWIDVPVKAELETRLGVPVVLENDVRAAVLAENALGAGADSQNWIGLWPGTGIGGGIVVGNRLLRGVTNSAGELGHITIKAGGPRCNCGARGHLEALASRSAIVRDIARRVRKGKKSILEKLVEGGVENAKSGDLAEAFRQGDKVTVDAIERAAKYLAIGIASVANTVNPELVVLGGGLTEALGEPFVRLVEKELKGRPMEAATSAIRVTASTLGDDAGIAGAGIAARELAASAARPAGRRRPG